MVCACAQAVAFSVNSVTHKEGNHSFDSNPVQSARLSVCRVVQRMETEGGASTSAEWGKSREAAQRESLKALLKEVLREEPSLLQPGGEDPAAITGDQHASSSKASRGLVR